MKFASLLATLSLAASSFAVYVTSADGTQIWTEATGNPKKPAVVFIPGFSCTSLAFVKQWSDPYMTSNLYMIRYDVRGQGISGQPQSNSSYTSKAWADDFKAVIDYFGVTNKKPILAGWSMGGVTAADVATYYGTDILGGVILMGSFPYRSMLTEVSTSWILSFIPALVSDNFDNFGPTAKTFVESCVAFGDQLDLATKYTWMGAIANQYPPIRNWSAGHDQDQTALMKASQTIPYLVLHGDMDKLIDGNKVKAFMQKNFGNFAFRLWHNVGHASFFDDPKDTSKEIVAFAQRLSGGWVKVSNSPDSAILPPNA